MIIFDVSILSNVVELFARGGGGGSGGGGGGGGGGSGGGGGGGGGVGGALFVFGYLPGHFIGAFFRRKMPNVFGAILTTIITLGYAALWMLLGWLGWLIAIFALFGGAVGYFGWFDRAVKLLKKSKATKANMSKAFTKDSAWDEPAITNQVQTIFTKFQNDWSSFNVESMRTYVLQPYIYHLELMLYALKLRKRRNDMQNIVIKNIMPIESTDSKDNSQDSVTYYIEARAKDSIIETIDGKESTLFTDSNTFSELWHMARDGNEWKLKSIEQTTANAYSQVNKIKEFAEANGMYYSLDWGWLLLPRQGVLFSKGAFGKSDINNHVIGAYKNLLIEIYTYIDRPTNDQNKNYVVAQVALPKRYGSIVVEAKESWTNDIFRIMPTPRGYKKVTLEWPDFNKRYRVSATDIEQVTAFELLHPVYMEKLFALPFKVSIEVVDNVVYLYSLDNKADYTTMLNLLKDAFKEMRL